MNYNYIPYVFDVETTGKDPEVNEIIEISFVRLFIHSMNNISKDQKTWFIRPKNINHIDDEALAVNGHKKEDLLHKTQYGKETYRDLEEVLPEIELWVAEDNVSINDRILAGHNIKKFDIPFLFSAWKKGGSPETIPFNLEKERSVIDTMDLVKFVDLCTGKRRRYLNLGSLQKAFHIKKAKAHTAEGDAQMNADFLIKIFERGCESFGSKFDDCYGE